MALLKTHWFAAANLLVALLVYLFYLFSVSGIAGENKKIAAQIENEINTIGALKFRNPTEAWYKIVSESELNLKGQADKIQSSFIRADSPIEKFFNINGSGIGVKIPDAQDRPQFKAVMAKKWDELLLEFSNDSKELKELKRQDSAVEGEVKEEERIKLRLTSRSVLQRLEPNWLRSSMTPRLDSEISISQKRFWIIKSICEILRQNGVVNLSSLEIKNVKEDSSYAHNGKPFWVVRDLKLNLLIEDVKVPNLMKAFFENDKLFTVVGLNQTNKVAMPVGVKSNAIFISFEKPYLVSLELSLRHYDYRTEGGEVFVKPSAVVPVTNSRSRGRGRR
jgi:hypothetical protein